MFKVECNTLQDGQQERGGGKERGREETERLFL